MIDPAWVALSLTKHLGGKTFRALLRAFDDDLHAILNAEATDLRRVKGVGPKITESILALDVTQVETALDAWCAAGVEVLTWHDARYPAALRTVEDAPPTLFLRGTLPDVERCYAVIGTRKPSDRAREFAESVSAALAACGHGVVSGLAFGVDAAAHMGTLAISGGRPVAVLGSGVLNVYPQGHRALAQAIVERGALLCEVAPGAAVSAPGLVARNRIITGLCDGVIVVETEVGGGAMHAARFAQVQGVPLYVMASEASGNKALVTGGATVITDDLSGLA